MKTRHYFILFLSIFLFIIGGIVIFDLIPSKLIPIEFTKLFYKTPPIDTIGHFISFFLLTWLINSLLKVPMILTAITLVFYAVLTEIGQYYLVFRSAEFTDVLADTVGVFSFILIKLTYLQFMKIRKPSLENLSD